MSESLQGEVQPSPYPVGRSGGSAAARAVAAITPLSKEATDAYHMLSRRGQLRVVDLGSSLDLRRNQLANALGELQSLRLVELSGDDIVAIPHHQVVDNVLTAQAEMLGHMLERLTVRHRQLRSLIDLRHALAPEDEGGVQSLPVRSGTRTGLYDYPIKTKTEIAAIHPGGQFSRELLARSLASAEASLRDGIRLRVIHQSAALAHQPELQYMHALEQLGARVRLRGNLPFRLLLMDDNVAVCALPTADGVGDTFMVRGRRVVGLLSRVFEATWIDATPLSAVTSPQHLEAMECPEEVDHALGGLPTGTPRIPDSPLRPQQESILRLLAEGHTDQAIARSLGITTRTVTRRISEIYETLGVDSRFQAGAAAHRLGLV